MALADALWSSVGAAYARPGVAPLCLRLQEQGDIDVMLLLCLCHAAGPMGAPLTPAEVDALRTRMEPWRAKAVRPVRRLRMALRTPVAHVPDERREAFRAQIKALELASERLQAGLVADWLDQRPPARGPVEALPGLMHFLGDTPVSQAELALLLAAFAD